MYCAPSTTTAASAVNKPTTGAAANCMMMDMITPKVTVIPMEYYSVRTARSGFPAPIFCAPRTDTADSMEDGTRNKKLMIFSTIPTAAASLSPRRFAMLVMTINATWISPSCSAIGRPIRTI